MIPVGSVKGFSVLELLVSVAIAAILSSLSFLMYDEYRQKTYAMAAVVDLKNIEVALRAMAFDSPTRTWPWETTIIGSTGHTPSIQSLCANAAGLGKYLPRAPVPLMKGALYYSYDNDNIDPGGYDPVTCNSGFDGVGIAIEGVISESVFNIIQNSLDGDNDSRCGKVRRHSPTGLYFMMANNYRDL